MERRAFLAAAGAAWLAGLAPAGAKRLQDSDLLFAAAYRDPQGAYGVAIADEAGRIVSRHLLPGRGHGFAASPSSSWLVTFARRPGNFALALDKTGRREPVLFHTSEGRHFYGHGAMSGDGRLLLAAENDYGAGAGVIGLYDATNAFARIGEFPSHGVGPHEIVLMPDAKTLCVANGGILTHPRHGRQKLNLPTMSPSIDFIDTTSGQLLSSHRLSQDLQRLSLRHMAVDARRAVWIGGQYQGDALDTVPVLARLDPDRGLEPVRLPGTAAAAFGPYVGSVAANREADVLAISSPRSGLILRLDTRSGALLSMTDHAGVCGLRDASQDFVASSERGDFAGARHDLAWDNHIGAV